MTVRIGIAMFMTIAFLSSNLLSQNANLAGNWSVEAPAASGENYQLGPQSGLLTLNLNGDEVTGTWKGRMPEPWKLTGRAKENTFELQTETRNLPATRDGEQTTVPRHWIFRGSVGGDELTGTMSLAGGGGVEPTQAFSAARKR